jgi:hypothetical protein
VIRLDGEKLEPTIEAGHYDLVERWITDNIKTLSGSNGSFEAATLGLKPLRFWEGDKGYRARQIAHELESWKLANLGHLLGFGATYPEAQKSTSIIALGESWETTGRAYKKLSETMPAGESSAVLTSYLGKRWLMLDLVHCSPREAAELLLVRPD